MIPPGISNPGGTLGQLALLGNSQASVSGVSFGYIATNDNAQAEVTAASSGGDTVSYGGSGLRLADSSANSVTAYDNSVVEIANSSVSTVSLQNQSNGSVTSSNVGNVNLQDTARYVQNFGTLSQLTGIGGSQALLSGLTFDQANVKETASASLFNAVGNGLVTDIKGDCERRLLRPSGIGDAR